MSKIDPFSSPPPQPRPTLRKGESSSSTGDGKKTEGTGKAEDAKQGDLKIARSAASERGEGDARGLSMQASAELAAQRKQRAETKELGFLPPPLMAVMMSDRLHRAASEKTGGSLAQGQTNQASLPMFAGIRSDEIEEKVTRSLEALGAGDLRQLDALYELPPSSFSSDDLVELATLIREGKEAAPSASALLRHIAENDPRAPEKFLHAASEINSSGFFDLTPDKTGQVPASSVITELFRAAENDPKVQLALWRGTEEKLLSPALQKDFLRDANPEHLGMLLAQSTDMPSREAASRLLSAQIKEAPHDIASRAAVATMKQLQPIPFEKHKDPVGRELAHDAARYLHNKIEIGTLQREEMTAIRDFAKRFEGGTLPEMMGGKNHPYHNYPILSLLTKAVERDIPFAKEEFVKAMQDPITAIPSGRALRSADMSVIRQLVSDAKLLPSLREDIPKGVTALPREVIKERLQPPGGVLRPKNIEDALQKKLHEALQHAFQHGKQGTILKDISDRIYGKGLLERSQDLNPRDFDRPRLEQDLKELLGSKEFGKELDRLRDETLKTLFKGKDHRAAAEDLEDYLLSNDFEDYLSLDTRQSKGIVANQLEILTALDPAKGAQTAKELAFRDISKNHLDILRDAPPAVREEALRIAFSQSDGVSPADALRFARSISGLIRESEKSHIKDLQKLLEGDKSQAAQVLKEQLAKGTPLAAMNGIGSVAATVIALSNDPLQDPAKALAAGASLLQSLSSTRDIVGVFQKIDFGRMGKFLDVAGKSGTALSAVSNTLQTIQALDNRDYKTAASKGGQIVGALMILRGATPLGLAVTLGSMLFDAIFGNTKDEQFLIDLGYKK
jgi:hypothetical protein